MQELKLKRIKKKSELPKYDKIPITSMNLNDMLFSLYLDSDDRYFLEGNEKIYEIVNEIN